MKITRRQLRIALREAMDSHLSKARSKRGMSDVKPFEKEAARRAERRHGKSEVYIGEEEWLEGPIDTDTIADLIPRKDRAKWETMGGEVASSDPSTTISRDYSQRDAYLGQLAWEIAYNDIKISDENIEKLIALSDWFSDTLKSAYLQKTADEAREEGYEWEEI